MCGVFGICVGVFGIWYSQRARESTREREPLALSGSLWLSLALSGSLWLTMGISESIWLSQLFLVSGSIWLSLSGRERETRSSRERVFLALSLAACLWLSPAPSPVSSSLYTTKQINLWRKFTCDKAATMGNNAVLWFWWWMMMVRFWQCFLNVVVVVVVDDDDRNQIGPRLVRFAPKENENGEKLQNWKFSSFLSLFCANPTQAHSETITLISWKNLKVKVVHFKFRVQR